eukprot:GHUV01002655.1.p1 GENE.GHUV01002655.1~~GHUV01002655.1.p1  ORF type:complete len:150 (+),score=17.31 GHUV01002655.1:206-655(+)
MSPCQKFWDAHVGNHTAQITGSAQIKVACLTGPSFPSTDGQQQWLAAHLHKSISCSAPKSYQHHHPRQQLLPLQLHVRCLDLTMVLAGMVWLSGKFKVPCRCANLGHTCDLFGTGIRIRYCRTYCRPMDCCLAGQLLRPMIIAALAVLS